MSTRKASHMTESQATNLAAISRLMRESEARTPSRHIPNRESLQAMRRAVAHYKKCQWKEAAIAAAEAADLDQRSAMAFHMLGLALVNLNEKHQAFTMYERALALDPTDPDLYLNIGTAAWDLGLLEGACQAFRAYIQMRPDCHKGYNNLGACLRDRGLTDDAIALLKDTIALMPEEAMLWNTLGTVMGELSDFDNAIIFYREAARLAPEMARVYHNLGHAYSHVGPLEESLRNYDLALKYTDNDAEQAETLHARGLCLAAMGRLEEAWPQYEHRLNPRCSQTVFFAVNAPAWKGEDLKGKRILFTGEQGLGDEIMFSSLVPDLIERVGPEGKVLIACDHRLVPLFRRSFPQAHVELEAHTKHNGTPVRVVSWANGPLAADFYTPMAVPLKYLRNNMSDFPTDRPFLKPDPERVRFWQDRLAQLGPGPYVGICWRSMLMTTQRRKYYSALDMWRPVLALTEPKFINLQYGDCREEIEHLRQTQGVVVHNFEDLDLKNNLDDNAALCAALDLVISAPTSAVALAAATGVESWILTPGRVWPQLGTDRYPWYPRTRVLMPERFGDWEALLQTAARELDKFQA